MADWKKIKAGVYHAFRDGEHVATACYDLSNASDWMVKVLDGTPMLRRNGEALSEGGYSSLDSAKSSYETQRRRYLVTRAD